MRKTRFKETEIGLIPEDWEVYNIDNTCTIKARIGWQGLTTNEYLKSGDYVLITGTDFCDGFIKWDTCNYVTKWRFEQDKNIQIREGDVLITKDGTIGKVAYLDSIPMDGTLNSGVFVIRPKDKDQIDRNFLSYVFKSSWFKDFIEHLMAGSTIVHLYQKDFVKFDFPLPSRAEQEAIADMLSDVDGLIRELDAIIAKKKAIKVGAMQELLTGRKRLEGFSGEWVEKKLEDVCAVLDNRRTPLNDSQREPGPFPYCGANGIVDFINRYEFDEPLILIAEDGGNFEDYATRPIAYQMRGKYFVNNHAHVLKAQNEYWQEFVFYQLVHKDITDLVSGGTRAKLTRGQLNIITILLPPTKAEQQAIAEILSDMDAEIAGYEAEKAKYEKVKEGMMQELLTGRVRVG